MARRRMRDRVLAGIGQGLQDTSGLLMRTLLQDRQQKRIDDRALAGQQAILSRQSDMADMQALNSLITKAAETGDVDPSAIRELARLQGRNVPDNAFENINPLPRRIDNSLGKTLMDADTPEKVPSNEDIFGVARRRGGGDMPDPALWDALSPVPADSVKGGIDYTQSLNPDVKQFADRAGARRRALMEVPTETVDVELPTGAHETRFVSKRGGPIQTKPTAQQQGEIAGATETAKDKTILSDDQLTKLKGETEARIKNLVEGLTRQARVTTASAISHAEKMAGLAPDVVTAEVTKAQRLAEGKDNSTEGERRAATNWSPLVKAHATALALEGQGAAIGTGDNFMTKIPVLNRAVPEQTKQYMQAARDFISTLGLIRSGVTVRPDEAESLFSTMFTTTGDDVTTRKNKQQSREVFLSSMQAMVGRSGDEAGRILAEAINKGQIPQTALASLSFDNKKLRDSLLANLKGVPKFDLQGNPIGVQQ